MKSTSVSSSDTVDRVRVSSATGGRVVFARLAGPGYRATLNGRSLPIRVIGKVFLAVDIPSGTRDAELGVGWQPPGQQVGIAAAVLGLCLFGLVVMQSVYRRSRRRMADQSG